MTHESRLLSLRFLCETAEYPQNVRCYSPPSDAKVERIVERAETLTASGLAASLRYREVLAARMGRSAKVSKFGMPAFAKNKKMSSNAAKPQSASSSAIKKAAPKKQAEKKKAQFKGDTFQGKLSKKA